MLRRWLAKRKLHELIRHWATYREIVLKSLVADPTPQEEAAFLALKARMAARLQALTERVPDAVALEVKKEIGEMTALLTAHTTLGHNELGGADWTREEFERVWNRHFIFLNRLTALPLSGWTRRAPLRRPPMPLPRTGWETRRRGSWLRGAFRGAVKIVLVGLFLYLVVSGFGVRIHSLRDVDVTAPSSAGDVVANVLNAAYAMWTGAAGFFAPVWVAYGPVPTVVLFGVLVVGIGYWVFGRS